MSTAKARAKPASLNGELPKSKVVRATQQKQFAAAVGSIAKRYGVKVASASTPAKNPYAMSAEQAVKVALQAGIITQAGNLTRTFK
ncbi:MAG: hypothetical protein ACREWI_04590 [Telluria sp.]